MQVKSLLAILSAVALTAATPMAQPEEHKHMHHHNQNSTRHEHQKLSDVCGALQPNDTQGLDLTNLTTVQIKCGRHFYTQAHHHQYNYTTQDSSAPGNSTASQ